MDGVTQYPPQRCLLCNTENGIISAGFKQIYPQANQKPELLDWWECRHCKGWFVYPLPTPEAIARYWATVEYSDAKHEEEIFHDKEVLHRRILEQLSTNPHRGSLLDVGSNFGRFLELARAQGWQQPIGMEPNTTAAETVRSKGFEVDTSWSIVDSPLAERHFDAIVATDVFCYDWHPFVTLNTFQKMLNSKGILAMRLSNKRHVLGIQRTLFRKPQKRNDVLSRTLQAQFHSIDTRSLGKILASVGFKDIVFHTHATTASWQKHGKSSLLLYGVADVLNTLSARQLNVSPGVLLIAHKP